MGFTIADMMIITKDKYNMELIAGNNGWANSISWLLMIEDTTITKNFKGKELVVTTGFGFDTEDKLLELIHILDEHHCSGLIINTGFYIKDISKKAIELANELDLPLMEVPWDVEMSEMIKDLTVRIFLQTQTDEQISAAFIKAIEKPVLVDEYREELSANFDVDGKFQVFIFTTKELSAMDSMDRKRVGYRLQIYLENISHNAHFFYYDGCYMIILNAVDDLSRDEIIRGFLERVRMRMPDQKVFVGEGSAVNDVENVHISYERALYAANFAMSHELPHQRFDELGIRRFTYSISDKLIRNEVRNELLRPILEYDAKHDSDLEETLLLYLKFNGSVQQVASEMFIHKNTILYRMSKIKELLGCDLEDGEQRLYYFIALLLKDN